MKHEKDPAQIVRNDRSIHVVEGLPARGRYVHRLNGEDTQVDYNLIPQQGVIHILNVALGETAKTPTWYLALFSGNVTPAANWTATNFTSVATEITSLVEGYTEATRPEWQEAPATGGVIGNVTNMARFTIATAGTLTIYGAALLSSNTRGGTAGVLVSASRFANPRVANAGDVFELGYEVEFLDV